MAYKDSPTKRKATKKASFNPNDWVADNPTIDPVLKQGEASTSKQGISSVPATDVAGSLSADPGTVVTGNITPGNYRRQMAEGPVQNIEAGPRFDSFQTPTGQTIHRNTGINMGEYHGAGPGGKASALYSDTATGATQEGFASDVAKYGIGATGLDAEGNPTGSYTQFSSPIQSPEMQQKAGGIEMAGVNPVGAGSPYGQNQYGNVGQGTNGITTVGGGNMSSGSAWWNKPRGERRGAFGEAQRIMDRMPYGTAGDRAKRKSMLTQARTLMGMGINDNRTQVAGNRLAYDQQADAAKLAFDYENMGINAAQTERQMGIDEREAMRPGKPTAGLYEQGDPVPLLDAKGKMIMDQYGEPITGPAPWTNTSTGDQRTISGSTNPAVSAEKDEKAKAIQAEYQSSNKTSADKKKATAALAAL